MTTYNYDLPAVRYLYPYKDGKNPFSNSSEEKLFIYASGLTFLSDELIYYKYPFDRGYSCIPMGYKAIIVNYRRDLILRGQRLALFYEDSELVSRINCKLHECTVDVERGNIEGSYSVLRSSPVLVKPEDPRWGLTNVIQDFNTYDEAYRYAIEQSNIDEMNAYLVTRVILHVNWH